MLGEDLADMSEGTFASKSVLARISIVAAGPIFNFIMAFAAAMILVSQIGYDAPIIRDVMDGFPAQEAGVLPGDKIVSMNGEKIYLAREVTGYLSFHQGEDIQLVVKREDGKHQMLIHPKQDEDGYYLMGITTSRARGGEITPFKVIGYGAAEVRYVMKLTLQGLKMLVSGQAGMDDMSGPVGVVSVIGETYDNAVQYGWFDVFLNMLNISILLSANLGIMNLLPIPALDGGRLFFMIVELIRGKRIDPQKEGLVHFVGILLLLALMIVVMFNDVARLV